MKKTYSVFRVEAGCSHFDMTLLGEVNTTSPRRAAIAAMRGKDLFKLDKSWSHTAYAVYNNRIMTVVDLGEAGSGDGMITVINSTFQPNEDLEVMYLSSKEVSEGVCIVWEEVALNKIQNKGVK